MSLLKVDNLSKSFPIEGGLFRQRVGSVHALKNVSFELEEGQSLGLVGESGSGKTTLAKILTRHLSEDAGQVLWKNQPAKEISREQWATKVQMIYQDPTASLNPKLSVRTLLEEPLRVRIRSEGKRPPDEFQIEREMVELLNTVGMPPDVLLYYPHQFSGGQKQRLAIARSLTMKPQLLVADEPVSALDLSVQAQILNLFVDLKNAFRLSLILISHDLAVVHHVTDRVLVLKDGFAVEAGPTETVLSQPSHPYTRRLLDSVPPLYRA